MTRIHPTHHRTSNDVAWKTLLEIATLFRTVAPWSDMEFVPPIAVEDAGGGETAYCNMARSPGHSCVFMVYLGTSGLTLWRDDLLGKVDPDSPVERAGLKGIDDQLHEVQLLVRRFHGYLINFNERGTQAIHRRHRLPQAVTENPDEKDFTSFEVISYPKGGDSSEPTPTELERVGEILLQLQSVADSVREDGATFIASRDIGELWHLSPTFDPETREMRWNGEWRASPVSIQEIEDKRLAIEAEMFEPFEERVEERTYVVEDGGEIPAMRPPSNGLKNVILHLDGFCSEHFSPSLYQEALDLAIWLDLARSPSPLDRGRPKSWASAIACHIARHDHILVTDPEKRVTTEEVCDWFGVAKSTVLSKLQKIEKIAVRESSEC